MKIKPALKLVTLFIILVNIISIITFDIYYVKIIRLLSSFIFLMLFFLALDLKDRLIQSFIILVVISDVLDFFYHYKYGIEAYSITKMIAFILLCIKILYNKKDQKFRLIIKLLFISVVLVNLLIANKIIVGTTTFLSTSQILSIQAYWMVSIFLAALSAKNFLFNDSKKALYLMIFIFLFVFADLNAFIGSYFEIYIFHSLDRVMYSLGFMYLGFYIIFKEKNNANKIKR